MEKTDTFFVIHNFNTVPEKLLEYCKDYIIYDASSDEKVRNDLEKEDIIMFPWKIQGIILPVISGILRTFMISCRNTCACAKGI